MVSILGSQSCIMISTYLLASLVFYPLLISAQRDECYWRSNNTIVTEPAWFVCQNTQQTPGGAKVCCFGDSECGEDSLCRMNGASGYAYFVGGCTDSSYNDTNCRKSCSTYYNETWIQWESSLGLWQCCGDNPCNGSPTNETFKAVSPARFSAVPSAASSTSSSVFTSTSSKSSDSSTTSISSTSSASVASSSLQSPATPSPSLGSSTQGSDSLSTGAIAGIAVGAAVGALAILGAIIFLYWRKKRSSKTQQSQQPGYDQQWQQGQHMQPMEHERNTSMPPQYRSFPGTPGEFSPAQELPAQRSFEPAAQELADGKVPGWELDGSGASKR